MSADGSEITISSVAGRVRVHRSFIHRHADLHAAVLKAAVHAELEAQRQAVLDFRRALEERGEELVAARETVGG